MFSDATITLLEQRRIAQQMGEEGVVTHSGPLSWPLGRRAILPAAASHCFPAPCAWGTQAEPGSTPSIRPSLRNPETTSILFST